MIVVFDLGPGDGGKGGVVHALSCHHRAHTIIKVGGAQGSNGVSTGTQEFAFSQWGCGTFEGVRTHITPRMIVSPTGLLNEADALGYHGVYDPFDLLTIDARSICATPYHGNISRIKEIARGRNPRGTIGSGVGEAFRDSISNPELVIRVEELTGDLRHKLSLIRDLQIAKLEAIGDILPEDEEEFTNEVGLLKDDGFLDYIVKKFVEAGKHANIVGPDYLKREVFDNGYMSIVESSHGVLTDSQNGFLPHVSAIRTLPTFTCDMLRDAGFGGEIRYIGVHRAYTIRHGAGPMPTADLSMNDALLPGSHKEDNRYQGKVRVGPLDLVLLRYAVDVCGVPIDGLAITWFDQVRFNGTWQVCDTYKDYDSEFFEAPDRIRIYKGDADGMLDYQRRLCSALFSCKPEITSIDLPGSIEEQYRLCDQKLRSRLGTPVHLVSFGPTAKDKFMKD